MMKSCHDVTMPVKALTSDRQKYIVYTSCGQCEFFVQITLFTPVPSEQHVAVPCSSASVVNNEKNETLGYKSLLLYLFRQRTYLQAMYYDMTGTRGKKMYKKCFISQLHRMHFHSIDIMNKKSIVFFPLTASSCCFLHRH